ncbi:MAG: PH domain-containing protein [Verrucomicrobiales bacterium]
MSTEPAAATPAPASAPESVLWDGQPSSWQNFWWWISIIGIPIAIWKHIVLRNTRITLTNQRLKIRTGVFNKKMEEIELYRVKDWTHAEPLMQRLLGYGSVTVVSSDRTSPELTYGWLKHAKELAEKLRSAVEAVRDRKRVRAIEMDDFDTQGESFQ